MKKKLYNLIAYFGIWFLQKVFPEYFGVEPLKPTDRYIEYPWVLENLPSPPATILDVGCSGSIFPLILKAIDYEVYGIDIRDYYPAHKFFFTKSNICIAPFPNNSFDIVTAISSIEHIGLRGVYGQGEDMDGDIRALKEIYRILKSKGKLLMSVPMGKGLVITNHHKIYNNKRIQLLLNDYSQWEYRLVQSPEADYDIGLIKAIK